MRNILSESNWLCLEIQRTLEFQFRLKMVFLLGDAKRERDGKTNKTGYRSPVPFSSSPSWPGRRGGEQFCTATTPPVCIVQSTVAREPRVLCANEEVGGGKILVLGQGQFLVP